MVIARAGVSEREFGQVFADESECVLAAFDEAVERLACAVQDAACAKHSWLQRLRAGVVAFLGFLDDEPGWGRLLVCEMPLVGPGDALRCQQRVMGTLCGLLDDGTSNTDSELPLDPMLTCELTVGGAIAVIRARMLAGDKTAFVELAPALMSFIVRPYLGQAAAQAELAGSPVGEESAPPPMLPVRATHRTLEVLRAIASAPRSSNRRIADIAGLTDEGQTSKLLARLAQRGVIENLGRGPGLGEPNAWLLTSYGQHVLRRLGSMPDGQPRRYRTRGVRGST